MSINLEENNSTIVDLTNYTGRGYIRKSHGSSGYTPFFVDIDSGLEQGELKISLTSAQTLALSPGQHVYDIELLTNSNPPIVKRVLEGVISVTPSVIQGSETGEGIG